MYPNQDYQKNIPTKGLKPTRYKSAKCYNEHFIYKTTECLEQHDSLNHSQHGKKKKRIIELYSRKKNRCWNYREDTCVNIYKKTTLPLSKTRNPVNCKESWKQTLARSKIYKFYIGKCHKNLKGWEMLMISRWQGVINWGSWERSSIPQYKGGLPFPASGVSSVWFY